MPTLAESVPAGASAYLVTVAPGGRPHTAPATVEVRGAEIVAHDPGRRTRANVEAGSVVTVLWSPADAADHTLIVDGRARAEGESLVVHPTRAVLHRPAPEKAPAPPAGACGADCVEVALA